MAINLALNILPNGALSSTNPAAISIVSLLGRLNSAGSSLTDFTFRKQSSPANLWSMVITASGSRTWTHNIYTDGTGNPPCTTVTAGVWSPGEAMMIRQLLQKCIDLKNSSVNLTELEITYQFPSGGSGGGSGGGGSGVSRPSGNTGAGIFVNGGKLYDSNGVELILHGANSFRLDNFASVQCPAQATKGANCARIANWNPGAGDSTARKALIDGAIAAHLVAIPVNMAFGDVETQNSGDTSLVTAAAAVYVGDASWLNAVGYEKHCIINLINEWGDVGALTTWKNTIKTAITSLRDAGLKHCIMIDAGGNAGQCTQSLIDHHAEIQAHDPQHNILFSFHAYAFWINPGVSTDWGLPHPSERQPYNIDTELDILEATGMPYVVGEYGYGSTFTTYDMNIMLSQTQSRGRGRLFWAWSNGATDLCMVTPLDNFAGTTLTSQGSTIVNGTNGWLARASKATSF